MILEQSFLGFKEGTSDKVYHVQLLQVENGYKVAFQYGKRTSNLKYGSKTPVAVSLFDAREIFHSLVSSKRRKGYYNISVDNDFRSQLEFMIALSY